MIRWIVYGALAGAVIAAPAYARAATLETPGICTQLRAGVSLVSIEKTLVASGFTPSDAGTYAGTTIRTQCPDLIPAVRAQMKWVP